jgi:CheY-like chemotaxis protein
VLERLKADEPWRHIPVIMTSALSECDRVVRVHRARRRGLSAQAVAMPKERHGNGPGYDADVDAAVITPTSAIAALTDLPMGVTGVLSP